MKPSFALVFALASGCAHPHPARFSDAEPVLSISDDAAIPVPQKRVIGPLTYADAFGRRPIVQGLILNRLPDALDVNALDETPPSSWLAEPAGGPLGAVLEAVNGPPIAPLLVLSRHPESGRAGIVVIDARGLRYELGRDPPDRPGVRTTAAAIATPLLRALGYRTPEVIVVGLRPSDLRLESIDGAPPPTDIARAFFDEGPPATLGVYRVTATRWPIGLDVGPTVPRDRREDDANDLIPHQDRRTLRALKVVRAWLRLPELGLATLRDVYLGAPGAGHLQHFIVGLEGALGADDARGQAVEPRSLDPAPNPTASEDPLKLILTLGLTARVGHVDPRFPFMGDFKDTVKDDDYTRAAPFEPSYRMLPADAYWMAKRLVAVSPDVIEAAVASAVLPAPAARELVRVIDARRLAVIERAFAEVTPCDVLETRASSVVLRDAGFSAAVSSRYELRFSDDADRELAPKRVIAPGVAVFTVELPKAPYVILRVRVARGARVAPRQLEAHWSRKTGTLRLVGVLH